MVLSCTKGRPICLEERACVCACVLLLGDKDFLTLVTLKKLQSANAFVWSSEMDAIKLSRTIYSFILFLADL